MGCLHTKMHVGLHEYHWVLARCINYLDREILELGIEVYTGVFLQYMPTKVLFKPGKTSISECNLGTFQHLFSKDCGMRYIPHEAISNYMKTYQNTNVIGNMYRYMYVDHCMMDSNSSTFPDLKSITASNVNLC